jgi:hypothetical protein
MSKLFAWALLMIVTGLALRAPQPTAVKPSQHGTNAKHAEVVLHWGTVVVPLAIDVP